MANLTFEKKILHLSKDYIFNETVGSLLLLLNSCMEDLEENEELKEYEIHQDILDIKKEIHNQTCALKLVLSDDAVKASAVEDIFETRKKLVAIYENIYHYYSKWNIISAIVSDELALRKYRENNDDKKQIDLAQFYSDCMEFMKTASDLSQYKHFMGQIFKCIPMKMARNKYFDMVYESLETAFGGESEESVTVSVETFRKTFLTELSPDYGKYFPEIGVLLAEKSAVNPADCSDDELDNLFEDLNLIYETLSTVEDYFQETFSALNSLIILYSSKFSFDELTEDNFGYKDIYLKVKEILENPADNLFNEQVIKLLEEYIEPVLDRANILNKEELGLLEKIKNFDDLSEELSDSLAQEGFIRAMFYANINEELFHFSFDENLPPASTAFKKEIFDSFIAQLRAHFTALAGPIRKTTMQILLSSLPIAMDIHQFMAYIQGGLDTAATREEILLIVDKIGTVFQDNGFNYQMSTQGHHHHGDDCDCGHEHHHHDEHCDCGHEHHHDEHCDCGHEHHH